MTRVTTLAGALCLAALAGCGGEMRMQNPRAALPALADVTPAEWQRLAERRLFFGHQSVGGNLIEGVTELLRDNPAIPLRVVETKDPAQMTAPAIYHAHVGANFDPDSKLADFARVSSSLADSSTALLKFCYVDIDAKTDPAELFGRYRRAIDSLRAAHPQLTIVHVTLPLQEDAGTVVYWKSVIRRQHTPYRTLNAIRARYNELLRAAYEGKEPVFDLAHFESLLPDGSIAAVSFRGDTVPFLAKEWTYDGGHLNEAGRRRIAQAFLVTLAKL